MCFSISDNQLKCTSPATFLLRQAWSSVRSPDQVFELLETVYKHFDAIARRRNIFKVETVGDCYVSTRECSILSFFKKKDSFKNSFCAFVLMLSP